MKTYKFRFRFHIASKGPLQGEEKRIDFTLPNGKTASLTCFDAEKFIEGDKFVVTSGGYCSEEEAFISAEQVRESVLCFGTKFGMGVDIGNDKASCWLGQVITDEIFEKHSVKIISDVHGISVFDEEYPVQTCYSSGGSLYRSCDDKFFTDEVCKFISSTKIISAKSRLAMELLAASYFDSSPRSKFLTLILATEALLEPDERSEKVQILVDDLKNNTRASDISCEEKKSILGTLNWLHKDSISQSLMKIADFYLKETEFDNMTAKKFISKCYDARCKMVHTGSVDESKYNIGSLSSNLQGYVAQLLSKITGL